MPNPVKDFSLGLGDFHGTPGIHVCHLYSDNEERLNIILSFIKGGGKIGEKIACFTDAINTQWLNGVFKTENLGYSEGTGDVTLREPQSAYFANGCFDPNSMIEKLKIFYLQAMEENYPASRVIGEMLPEIETIEGGDRLAEYESRVSLLQREMPVTTVCQYDVGKFSGKTIMEILKVHPYILSKGEVIENPLYIPPEEFLSSSG